MPGSDDPQIRNLLNRVESLERVATQLQRSNGQLLELNLHLLSIIEEHVDGFDGDALPNEEAPNSLEDLLQEFPTESVSISPETTPIANSLVGDLEQTDKDKSAEDDFVF